jgi:hypothetical protein
VKHYARLLTTESTKIGKGGSNKQTQIHDLVLTATAAGTLTLTDGVKTYVLDVVAGINTEFCHDLVFEPGADVTFTAASATISIFANYTYK